MTSLGRSALLVAALAAIAAHVCTASARRLAAAELSAADFRFDGPLGSPGTTIEKVGANHFRVTLGRAPKNPQWSNMLQFTIERHAKGNALRLDAGGDGLSSNELGLRQFGSWSYDMQNWRPIQAAKVDGAPALLFPEFTEDRVYFGGEVPMTYEQHEAMIHRWARHPHASSTVIGHSPEGRKIYRLTVTDPDSPYPVEKRWVHHVVNQHCYEYNAQWRIAGMIDWLLGDSGAECRKRHIAHFVVMINVDGPSHGFGRVNTEGFDMNRSYVHTGSDRQKQATEVYLVQKDMESIHAKTPLTTTWSMHTWNGERADLMVRWGKGIGGAEPLGGFAQFVKILSQNDAQSQFNPVQNLTTEPTPTHWCSGTHLQFGVTAFCCEGCGGMFTKEQNLHVGAVLMKTLDDCYTRVSP